MLPRIAVLASGEGTTLQAIMETCNVIVVILNNHDSRVLRRTRQLDVPGIVVGKTANSDLAMLAIFESSSVTWFVAGKKSLVS